MENGISGTVHTCTKTKTIKITVFFNEIKRINNNQKTSFTISFYNRFVFVSSFCVYLSAHFLSLVPRKTKPAEICFRLGIF